MTQAAYPTKVNFKTWVGISGASDDTLLDWLADGAAAFVERYCGRSFVDAAAQTVKVLPEYPNLLGKYKRTLLIKSDDIVSITTVVNGDGVTVSSDDYTLHPLDGPPYYRIELHADSGLRWWRGSDGAGVVTLTCTTGFAENVPDDIFLAILKLMSHEYRARSSGGRGMVQTATRAGLIIEPGKVPPDIIVTLNLYRRARA